MQDFRFRQVFVFIDKFIGSAISNWLKQPVLVIASYDNSSCLSKTAQNNLHITYLVFLSRRTNAQHTWRMCNEFQVNDNDKKK